MGAAQTHVYHAPASRAGSTQSIRIQCHITHSLEKKRGGSRPPSNVSERIRRTAVRKKGVGPVSREEVTHRRIRASYPRPLIALSRRFCSCTGASVLPVCTGPYDACAVGWVPVAAARAGGGAALVGIDIRRVACGAFFVCWHFKPHGRLLNSPESQNTRMLSIAG